MEDNARYSKETVEAQPPRGRKRWLWLLALAPLMVCLGCVAITAAAVSRFSGRWSPGLVPITGDPLPAETPFAPDPELQPTGEPAPGGEYRAEVDRVLQSCYGSFHEFFMFEELVVSQPGMLEDEGLRQQANRAADSFHEACGQLGELPRAPIHYAEADHWLRKAAAEVAPASENFVLLLGTQPGESAREEHLRKAVSHVMNFIEYTSNAETVFSSMDDRREF